MHFKSFTLAELKKGIELFTKRGKSLNSREIAFFSPKGRAGRTTVAALLALTIAEKSGERVAIIDGDLQFGDMPIFFDVEPKLNNVFDITHMRRALEMFHTQNYQDKNLYTCFTRVNPCTEDERLKIQRQLGYLLTDILPNEYQMISLANSGRLLKGLPKDSLFMKCIGRIADEIISDKK